MTGMQRRETACHFLRARNRVNSPRHAVRAVDCRLDSAPQDSAAWAVNTATAAKYTANGGVLRRVTALVEIRGEMKKIVFLTNNLEWSARTIAELYRARWGIETFFRELKQTGHNDASLRH